MSVAPANIRLRPLETAMAEPSDDLHFIAAAPADQLRPDFGRAEPVTFPAADGARLAGLLYRPVTHSAGGRGPAVALCGPISTVKTGLRVRRFALGGMTSGTGWGWGVDKATARSVIDASPQWGNRK